VHVLVVVMFDISVRTAILQYCFWCSLFHFTWFKGGSGGPADPDRNQWDSCRAQACASRECYITTCKYVL